MGPPRPLFGCERYGYVPGHHHDRQGPDLGVRADGRDDRRRPRRRAVHARHGASFAHGFTFGGHPVAAAVALANIDILEREDLLRPRARATRRAFRAMLDGLRDIPIVGDVRGAGYFQAIELVKDRDDEGSASTHAEAEALLRGFLAPASCIAAGLICRTDDRGDPGHPARRRR